ncbi:leucyl aminopeptidase family protein [Hymenobacter chitinivorans]|uniref:Leucyl aminopeptidase n=1 Tax=Hymenobacter chitinivorans DSM 11115 TaxID=1121954 RepID=A0A2M9BPX2_9BACT|nr:leucyl aminopeptidase [Hymenobacter chitinivorans]PJJ60005.1 leucyl aminopeptidase [Hymenobacter chitinivorans DSM 11115]
MSIQLATAAALPEHATAVFLLPAGTKELPAPIQDLHEAARQYVATQLAADNKLITVNHFSHQHYFVVAAEKPTVHLTAEAVRKSGHQLHAQLKAAKVAELYVQDLSGHADSTLALALVEGLALTAYQFEGYKTDEKSKEAAALTRIHVVGGATDKELQELDGVLQGVFLARDLINMPLNKLNAEQFAERMATAGEEAGFHTEILDLVRIEALRMGGLLAVNQGSPEPPTFTIMEYKPEGATNAKPYVLVGKGVVFDTGGLSLKPTPASMDMMKCDMSGGAAVTGVLYALAKNQVPLHVIGLVPATDNRPGGLAFAPGDVLTMYSGLTVEVLNTDAEGRLILADALAFAQKYDPEFVVDIATLTGSAARAIGKEGIVAMGTASEDQMAELKKSGNRVHERVVEFPMWEEYAEHIKSDIADINNLGKAEAGAISAGKFLERFTGGYPWVHLDIAGPAYLLAPDSYRGKGGTGTTVRLLYDFLKNRA